jgi:hypothetical protein
MSRELSALSRVTGADSLRDMKDVEIEVFRAGKASRGITADDLAPLAEFDCDANPVPLVIGHPKSDSPAKGVIKKFRVAGSSLFATLGNIADDLVESVKSGELLNRSIAFFSPEHEANPTPGKLAPRHLGFLGGSAPGIPGMSPLKNAFAFAAGDDEDGDDHFTVIGDPAEALVFEAAPTPVRRIQEEPAGMTPEQIAAEEKRLKDERTTFEAQQREFAASRETARKAANKTIVDGLVANGKVLPADKPALELVFNALSDDELEFSADDKGTAAGKLAAILGKGPAVGPKLDAAGKPVSPTGDFNADDHGGDKNAQGRSIAAKARKLVEAEPGLTFEAAVERLTNEAEG